MKTCGTCHLCCKIAKIPPLKKPSNKLCEHCVTSSGGSCSIYDQRPDMCANFKCLWLTSDLPDHTKPELTHLYISHQLGDGIMRVSVDTDHPNAWREGVGKELVDAMLERGVHLMVIVGNQLTFLPAQGRDVPERLQIDWIL